MPKPYLEAGKIVGTHGVKGELRVEPWCDSPQFLTKLKTFYWDAQGTKPVRVLSARPHKNLLLVMLEGCSCASEGDALRGKILYLSRADIKLPRDRYFVQDIIGLSVVDADSGKKYGIVTDVLRTGANDVYQITGDDKQEYLIPVIPDVVIKTEIEEGILQIRPIRGIFEDAD